MDVHHHDSGAAEATGATALMLALFAFVMSIILLAALVAWAPWDDDNSGGGPVDQPNADENAPNVDIDVDNSNDGAPDAPAAGP